MWYNLQLIKFQETQYGGSVQDVWPRHACTAIFVLSNMTKHFQHVNTVKNFTDWPSQTNNYQNKLYKPNH